VILDG